MLDFVANIEYINRKQEAIKKAISVLKDLEDYTLITSSENLSDISNAINYLNNIDKVLDRLDTKLTALVYEEADLIADIF